MPPSELDHRPDDDELNALLDRVMARYHLPSRDSAFDYLLHRRLRRSAVRLTGRGRALYPVGAPPK